MSGVLDNDDSLVNGAPARQIGPETGSSGDATMTRHGGTSEGTHEADDSRPAPAAGLDTPVAARTDLDEDRSFEPAVHGSVDGVVGSGLAADEESIAQQIADGESHILHGDKLRHRLHPKD